jgi:putative PIN family toxin of toxin-antitoxin system
VTSRRRVVYDCNVLFQALISPAGPSATCVTAALDAQVALYCSPAVFDELRDVASRPALRAKFVNLTDERIQAFIESVVAVAQVLRAVPPVFAGCRDPDDNHYIDLAVAANAAYVVTRDKDLLSLIDRTTPAGKDLSQRFPELRIIEPQTLLLELRQAQSTPAEDP